MRLFEADRIQRRVSEALGPERLEVVVGLPVSREQQAGPAGAPLVHRRIQPPEPPDASPARSLPTSTITSALQEPREAPDALVEQLLIDD